jgi:hypothetical protein
VPPWPEVLPRSKHKSRGTCSHHARCQDRLVEDFPAAGPPGVERVLSILRQDIDRTLQLFGVNTVADVDGSVLGGPIGGPR